MSGVRESEANPDRSKQTATTMDTVENLSGAPLEHHLPAPSSFCF